MVVSWEGLELPALRWVLAHGDAGTGKLALGSADESEAVPVLSMAQLDEALVRLEDFGLITGLDRIETNAYSEWPWLRPTADGLRVLGEWPPEESATLQRALVQVLLRVADELPPEEAGPVRRAAGGVGQFAGGVLSDVAQAELKRAGGSAVE